MPDVFIPDVSEYQSNVNAPALIGGGYKAIIVRIAYGTREDRLAAAGRVGYMRAAGFTLIGWYVFLRASQPLAAQIALVEQILGRLDANEFLVVDWERDLDGSLPPVTMRDQALNELSAWGGKPCVLYGPASLLRQYPAPAADPEWPASYETPDPSLTGEVMWQYCVDEQTEALTADGWKGVGDLRVGDLLLTINPSSGLSEWQPALKVSVFRNDRPLVSFESAVHSSLSTVNHRWLVAASHRDRLAGRYTFKTSDSLVANDWVPCAAPAVGLPDSPKWADAFVELVGWYYTDGWPNRGISEGLYISQSAPANPDKCARIRACLTDLLGPAVRRNKPDQATWSEGGTGACVKFRLSKKAAENFHQVAPDRIVTYDFVRSLTAAQLRLFVAGALGGDSFTTTTGGSTIASQAVPERLDALEMACALLGYATQRAGKPGQWTLTLRANSGCHPVTSRRMVDHHGDVWCPTTPNGTWFARRRGKSYFTGNTDGQYTSGGYRPINFPGIGLCDATVYHGDWGQLSARLGTPTPPPTPTPTMISHAVSAAATRDGKGYWIADAVGHVYRHGDAADQGQVSGPLAQPIVSAAADPATAGFWLAAADGGVFAFGALFKGSEGGVKLNKPICAFVAHPSGNGYWLVAGDGGVFAFGAAGFHGSTGNLRLAAPIVAAAVTPSGNGYWLAGSDGGVFSMGDAPFKGSRSGQPLNAPVVAMLATPSGQGYWLVAADGGVFNYGDAAAHGSMGGKPLAAPIVAAMRSPDGGGYALVGGDGGIFNFGDFIFSGAGA